MRKVMDFYELTMAYSDWCEGIGERPCYFDIYFRRNLGDGGYNIMAGLDDIIEYLQNFSFNDADVAYLHEHYHFDEEFLAYLKRLRFTGDVWAVVDGTPVFRNEPCITVRAPSIQAQLLETDLLNYFNHACMVATKTARIVTEAQGRAVMEFGARRAHGGDAAMFGAKYAYLAGAVGTSCYATGKAFGVPLMGTMAHSHVMKYDSEYEAFLGYARAFPSQCVLLVDTYDTLRSGLPNAIRVAREFLIPHGFRLKGIRLDSGDLAYLSKRARAMLDEAGLQDCKISASNALDEVLIHDLLSQGAPIDSFGVGENLITSKDSPVFGGVYKLAALEDEDGHIVPKIKISENVDKITTPGFKKLYRFYDRDSGFALGDVLALHDEHIPKDEFTLFHEYDTWKQTTVRNYYVRELHEPIFQQGRLVYTQPDLNTRRAYCAEQMETLYPEMKRLNFPHKYYVDLSVDLWRLKRDLIRRMKGQTRRLIEINGKEV